MSKMPRLSVLIVMLLVVLLALTACEFSVTTANLSEVTMATKVNDTTSEPVEKTDVFSPDTPVIYCTVKLSNAPSDTKVKSEWIATNVEGVDKNSPIDTAEVTSEGTRYIAFNLTRQNNPWPAGTYTVKLYVDGKESTSTTFTVAAKESTGSKPAGTAAAKTTPTTSNAKSTPTAAPAAKNTPTVAAKSTPTAVAAKSTPTKAASSSSSSARLSEVTMTEAVDDVTMEPLGKTNVFSPSTDIIYCSVKLSDAPAGTKITAEWVATKVTDVEAGYIIDTVTLTADGTRYLGFNLETTGPDWPVGKYTVNLYLNDAQVAVANFTVSY